MNKDVASFIAKVLGNKNRDLFVVRLGTTLLLAKFGIVGRAADLVGYFLRGFIGLLIEDGTFVIDVGLNAYREGRKLKEFEAAATEAYRKATAKVYSEDQKNEIRKMYLDIIARVGVVGVPNEPGHQR